MFLWTTIIILLLIEYDFLFRCILLLLLIVLFQFDACLALLVNSGLQVFKLFVQEITQVPIAQLIEVHWLSKQSLQLFFQSSYTYHVFILFQNLVYFQHVVVFYLFIKYFVILLPHAVHFLAAFSAAVECYFMFNIFRSGL